MALDGRRSRRRVQRESFVLSEWLGLNDDMNHAALDNRDLRRATNVMLFRARELGGRFGYHRDPFNAALNSGASVNGIFDFTSESDSVHRPIFVSGNAVLEEDASGDPSTASAVAGGTAPANTDQNAVWTNAFFNDALYIAEIGNVPLKIPNSGNKSDLSGWYSDNRKPRYVHEQFGFLFFAGYETNSPTNTLNPMTVNYGELEQDDQWRETNIVQRVGGLASYGNEYVTGMFRHRDFVMIGTNRRIYPVSYNPQFGVAFDPWQVQRPLNVGLAHQRTVVSINGEFTLFMDPMGHIHAIREVARGFGDIGVSNALSAKVRNYVSNLNTSRIRWTDSAYLSERGLACWLVSQGVNQGSHNELLVLDLNDFPLDDPDPRAAKWFRWTNVIANTITTMRRDSASTANTSEPDADGPEFLVFGTNTGWIKRFTEETSEDEDDSGTGDPITTEAFTKFYDFEEPANQKSIVECLWELDPASNDSGPDVQINYDYGMRRSNIETLDMSDAWSEGDLLGSTFILGQSKLGEGTGTTRTRTKFSDAGTLASVEMTKRLSGTQKWRLQRATLVAEIRGVSPERLSA